MLNFKKFGDNDTVLIILHGLFGSLDNWQGLAQIFSNDFTVYILDQRNHGKSPHFPKHNYTLMAEDLKVFMDENSIQKAHLLGHSMGGKTVMQFAVNYPYMIDRLIVADIAPKYYPPHHQDVLKALHSVDFSEDKSREDIQKKIARTIHEQGTQQFLLKGLNRVGKDEFKWKFNLKTLSEHIENIGEELEGYTYFTNPTLFLKGEYSSYINESDLLQIEEMFPQSEVVEIKGAGHWLHAENPKDFCEEILSFLK